MGYRDRLKGAVTMARGVMQEAAALSAAHDPTAHLSLHGPAGKVSYGFEKRPALPDRIEDPAAWERAMLADRAAREAARAPYLAPDRPPLHFTRVGTRGATQAQDVTAHLASSGLAGRPDLVYGLYRVPDRIRPSAGNEKGRVVEWDIVHAATEPLASAPAPADVIFQARDRWVARRPGDPGVLDEDLALAYLLGAGIGPERTLGVTRHVTINPESGSDEGGGSLLARVLGVHAFHAGRSAADQLVKAAPVTLPPGPPPGIWLEVLRWEPIARVVHPMRQHRPRLPSAFPHLPLTPQELLWAYLEIVGLAPHDSYGVQITYHEPFDLLGRTSEARFMTVRKTTGGDELPCVDGKHRVRMHGGQHVVLTYRDTPAYAEGRARWAAYEAEVLQSSLAQGPELRPPVPKPTSRIVRTFERIAGVVEFFTDDASSDDDGTEPPRYCWPPAS